MSSSLTLPPLSATCGPALGIPGAGFRAARDTYIILRAAAGRKVNPTVSRKFSSCTYEILRLGEKFAPGAKRTPGNSVVPRLSWADLRTGAKSRCSLGLGLGVGLG